MKKNILAAILLCAPIVLLAQKEISKTFTGVKSIRIQTASGDCKIVKSASATVGVSVRHGYDEKEYEPIFEQSGDRLDLKENYKVSSVMGSGSVWTLTIPEGIDVRFRTGSGDIEAANMKLRLDVNTGSGSVVFRKVNGDVTINTGSGDLDIEEYDGVLDANTGSGTARVTNSKGELKVNCGSGNIRIADSQAQFRANTGSGDVTARNLQLAGSSRFSSGSGDAQVILAGTLAYDVSVGSGSGNAELNFNGNEIAGEIVMSANKDRGSIVAPFEFDKVEETKEGGDQITVRKSVVKGNSRQKVSVSTGSGEAIIKK